MVISYCQLCNVEIKHKIKRSFCSNECKNKLGEIKRTANCTGCNIQFIIKKGESFKGLRRFCSKSCWDKFQVGENNPAWKGVKEQRECAVCKSLFIVKRTNGKTKKCCSAGCKEKLTIKNNEIETNCLYCNTIFITHKSRFKKRDFCSRDCADKNHSKKMNGSDNSNYVNGSSRYSYGQYPKNWNKIADEIRIRDDNQCQLCNISDKNLHVHHIDFDRHNNLESNLITLCHRCHTKQHGKYSRYKCKEELLKVLEEKKTLQSMSII